MPRRSELQILVSPSLAKHKDLTRAVELVNSNQSRFVLAINPTSAIPEISKSHGTVNGSWPFARRRLMDGVEPPS